MAAGDFRYLRLHALGKKLLGLRCDHLSLVVITKNVGLSRQATISTGASNALTLNGS